MKKKVTIQDIADALGISRNTVSKAINNSEGLAEATREKILQKAVEMGYKQFSYFSTFISASDTSPAITGYQGDRAADKRVSDPVTLCLDDAGQIPA